MYSPDPTCVLELPGELPGCCTLAWPCARRAGRRWWPWSWPVDLMS